MFLIGRGRYARATYSEAGGQSSAALVALTNRYLIDPAGPGTPDPFTSAPATPVIVAATVVTRRASGIFSVAVQMPAALAAADVQNWAAVALFGVVASGGTPNGSWLLATGTPITVPVAIEASPMAVDSIESDATTLSQTVTLVGVNANPLPAGQSTIIIAADTGLGTLITPGNFFGVAFELP